MREQDKPDVADEPSVRRVEKTSPTHTRGMERLVGINATFRQGDPCAAMRFDLELNGGTVTTPVNKREYILGIRTCLISLLPENCTIKVSTRYEHWLEPGAFQANEVQRQELERSHDLGANLEAAAETTSLWPTFKLKLWGGARRRAGKTKNATSEQKARIELIATNGQDCWRVGDPVRGDARRPDSMLFGTYFRERSDGEEATPLCLLERTNHGPVLACVRVTAPSGSLVIKPLLEKPVDPAPEGVWRRFKELSSRARRRHQEQEEELRARISGLIAAKAFRRSGPDQRAENELTIVQQTVVALGSDVEDEHGGESLNIDR